MPPKKRTVWPPAADGIPWAHPKCWRSLFNVHLPQKGCYLGPIPTTYSAVLLCVGRFVCFQHVSVLPHSRSTTLQMLYMHGGCTHAEKLVLTYGYGETSWDTLHETDENKFWVADGGGTTLESVHDIANVLHARWVHTHREKCAYVWLSWNIMRYPPRNWVFSGWLMVEVQHCYRPPLTSFESGVWNWKATANILNLRAGPTVCAVK